MTEKELFELIKSIEPLDEEAMTAAAARQEKLAKPPGSLGRLEDISIRLAGITGKVKNSVDKKCIVIMSGDNGVAEEGIASAPQTVTRAQTINFTRRLTGVGALARHFDTELLVVDLGMKYPAPPTLYTENPRDAEGNITKKIVDRRIGEGTKNIAVMPAMEREEALYAIGCGIEMAREMKAAAVDIFGVGEMGIGNTTTSGAVLCGLAGVSAEETTGRGGGILDSAFEKKKRIIGEALRREGFENVKRGELTGKRVIDLLCACGGFDICAMTGAFIGGAIYRIPAVIDGYISAVSALAAMRIAPLAREFMFASHASYEKGYALAIKELELSPMLNLNMRLGEGSGCPLAFQIIDGACGVMCNMATFEEADINDEYLEEIRRGNCF